MGFSSFLFTKSLYNKLKSFSKSFYLVTGLANEPAPEKKAENQFLFRKKI